MIYDRTQDIAGKYVVKVNGVAVPDAILADDQEGTVTVYARDKDGAVVTTMDGKPVPMVIRGTVEIQHVVAKPAPEPPPTPTPTMLDKVKSWWGRKL